MSQVYQDLLRRLAASPKRWLVTGAAGFIGSNLVETLLRHGQYVRALDNFATGYRRNLELVRQGVGEEAWSRFEFVEGDIVKVADCQGAVQGVEYVLHQAALGSVPRSIEDPISSNRVNIEGFLNMLIAARDHSVQRFVYASSSAVYGDSETMPKVEGGEGRPLSPYAATKACNELYAQVFYSAYGLETVGLRYFNVFGPRQDPQGAYAAVVPRWVASALKNEQCVIYGDGETSRDFCHIDNVVQANILSACAPSEAVNEAFNIACGERTTLKQLHDLIWKGLVELRGGNVMSAKHEPFRTGDIRHSLADISKARRLLGFEPVESLAGGLKKLVAYSLGK